MSSTTQAPYYVSGACYLEAGLYLAARDQWRQWADEARARGDVAGYAGAVNALAALATMGRLPDAPLPLCEEAVRVARAAGDPLLRLKSLVNLSQALDQAGHHRRAATLAEEALGLALATGAPAGARARILLQVGASELACERLVEAEAALTQALALFREQRDVRGEAGVTTNLGILCGDRGEPEGGLGLLARADLLARQAGDSHTAALAASERGRLALQTGNLDLAAREGDRALGLLLADAACLEKDEVARLCELFSRIALATGQGAVACQFADRAVIYYGQAGLWREYSRAGRLQIDCRTAGAHPVVAGYLEPEAVARLEYLAQVFNLLDSIESSYPELRGRGELVTHYALQLAGALEMGEDSLKVISHAGRLCDIGLSMLEPEVLKGKRADRYQLHPGLSEEWLRTYPVPPGCLEAVRHHHESWDGSGFPDGLRGEAIPLAARVLAVAERYVDLALDRGWSHQAALGALHREAGVALDPAVVSAFVDLHHRALASAALAV